jgi:two-component system nitrate/nitrite response regulator NarL
MNQTAERSRTAFGRITLTAREREIIRHIAQGSQNDAIAHVMGISANTVKTHIGNIMRKFGLHNRTQVAMLLMPELVAAHGLGERPVP